MLAGKDKGKEGKILKVLPVTGRVVVDGLNLVKKHQKPRRQGEKGQIVEIPRSVDVSNVGLLCAGCGRPTRVGYKKETDQKKARFCRRCQQEI